jgi:cell division protease FtsH
LYTGIGVSRVKDLFKKANLNSPCIIFIDEIDSIAQERDENPSESEEENESLNQLLIEMDGFYSKDNILIIGATNNLDLLDPAILRPGRFDSVIHISLPDYLERIDILKYYISDKKLTQKVNLETIAHFTEGFTGADLKTLINEANIVLVKTKAGKIEANNLNNIINNMVWGAKTEPLKNTKLIYKHAYYEIGRGIIAFILKSHKNIDNITLVARDNNNSSTNFLPRNPLFLEKQSQLISDVIGILGGYINENLVFGLNETLIPFNEDLVNMIDIISEMCGEIGFSKLGPINISDLILDPEDLIFSTFKSKSLNDDTEIFNILDFCARVATKLTSNNRLVIDILVDELLVSKTLENSAFSKILL